MPVVHKTKLQSIQENLRRIKAIVFDLEEVLVKLTEEGSSEPEISDLITIHEAARMLDITVPTMYVKVNHKEIPYYKGSKKLYFSRKEIEEVVRTKRRHVKPSSALSQSAHSPSLSFTELTTPAAIPVSPSILPLPGQEELPL